MEMLVRVGARLARRWHPFGGWAFWAVTMTVALWPALVLGRTGWVRHSTGPLVETAFLAAMAGWLLFPRVTRGRLRGLILAGLVYPVLLTGVARVWPPMRLLFTALVHTLTWTLSGGEVGDPARAWASWADVFLLRYLDFHRHLAAWAAAARGGDVVSGRVALLVLFGLLVYANACWVVWVARARGNGGRAALPGIVIVAWNTYWAGTGTSWLGGMVGLTGLLAVAAHYAHLEAGWQRHALDFSDQLRLDFAAVGLTAALGLGVFVPLVTALTSPTLYARVWGVLARPWAHVEEETARLFPDVARPARSPLGRATTATLPRAHKLGTSPRLLDSLVMTVRPRGGRLPHIGYWFGQAYDVYTGEGWEQSPWQVEGLAAGQMWEGAVGQERAQVWHTVILAHPSRDVYAAGVPLAVDRPADALTLAGKDLVGMRLRGPATTYAVLAAVNVAPEAHLRAAGDTYPDWVKAHYLQVPEGVPPRVRDLARRITMGATTPYDRARAIEAYLRQIPYSLDVPLPPPGRDVVDWFLFDLRRGYCDYYATAFVLLARLNGIPTRFVIGYAQGEWDAPSGEYRVREREAHSWPEVYFPGYGWIPFEPTAARAVFRWRRAPTVVTSQSAPSWEETMEAFRAWAAARWRISLLVRLLRGLVLILAVMGALVVGWWGYWLWRVPRPARPYAQLVWLAARLGVRWRAGWTPLEFVEALRARVGALPIPPSWRARACALADSVVARYTVWRFGSTNRPDSPCAR